MHLSKNAVESKATDHDKCRKFNIYLFTYMCKYMYIYIHVHVNPECQKGSRKQGKGPRETPQIDGAATS